MNPSDPSDEPALRLAVLCADARVAGDFVRQISRPGEPGVLQAGDTLALLVTIAGDDMKPATMPDRLARIGGIALLVHHIDIDSMEAIKAAYASLPGDHRIPMSLVLVREPGKLEFKMACPTCNQKLWVRDEDAGRVGRCPHCKKTFQLPSQVSVMKAQLDLPDAVPVVTSILGHASSCAGPVAELAERALHRQRAQKTSTVHVQLPPDAQGPAAADSSAL